MRKERWVGGKKRKTGYIEKKKVVDVWGRAIHFDAYIVLQENLDNEGRK